MFITTTRTDRDVATGARVFHAELEEPVAERSGARVARVRLIETRKNSFVYGEPE